MKSAGVAIVANAQYSSGNNAVVKGRNPQTGAEIQIAASKSGKFTAGKDLKGL